MSTQNTNTTNLVSVFRALVPQQDRQANWTTKITQAHNDLSMPLSDPMEPQRLASLKAALKSSRKTLDEFNEQVSKRYVTVPDGGWKYNLPPGEKTPSMALNNPFSAAEQLKDAIKIMEAVVENVKNGWWALQKEEVVVKKNEKANADEEEMEM